MMSPWPVTLKSDIRCYTSMAEAEMNEALSAQFFHFPWKMVASDCLQGIEVASAAAAVSLKNEQKDGQTESEGRRRFLLSFCLLL